MTNIVLIQNGEAVASSLIIAEGVGNPHASVIRLIRDNIDDLREFGPIGFEIQKGSALPQGGYGKATEYALLNEGQATLLLTYMRNNDVVREFKKRLVKAFMELKSGRAGPELTKLEILQMAIASEERVLQLEARAAADAPKVAFHDKVAACDDFISVRDAAQVIGTGRSRLMAKLRTIGWVDKWNTPYQRTIDQGLMQSKVGQFEHPEYGLKKSITPMITGKGLVRLQRIFLEEQAA
jgi:phage antirepressor YoqD-like protein